MRKSRLHRPAPAAGASLLEVLVVVLIVGIMAVVVVFAAVLSMARGFERTMSLTGADDIAIILRGGATAELNSGLSNEQAIIIGGTPGVVRNGDDPVASAELFVLVDIRKRSNNKDANVTLRGIQDWIVRYELQTVPGVAEVNTWGGERKQYQVLADPAKLVKFGLTLDDVFTALSRNNMNVGGGYVVEAGELHLVQGISLTRNVDEIGAIVIASHDGVPVRIGDVGEVVEGHEIRRGAATAYGKGEVVLGLGFMLMGENSHEVTGLMRERMAEVRASLPEGVVVEEVYERTELVDQVLDTVRENLFEGAILVIAVLAAPASAAGIA